MPGRPTKKKTAEEIREEKEALYAAVEAGLLTLGQATRRMRKIVGMTQTEYAEKVLRIYPRVLMEIERDRGNPTLETLEKIGRPFGFRLGFVAKKASEVRNVNSAICAAIRKKAVLQFMYKGHLRIVEPHAHGISTTGKEVLRGVQIGESETRATAFGKLFEVARMRDLRETGEIFAGPGTGFNPGDRGMSYVHCHL